MKFPLGNLALGCVVACGFAATVRASIFITTDTPTSLAGSFSASGISGPETGLPTFFADLPAGDNQLTLQRSFSDPIVFDSFGTGTPGTPSNPTYFQVIISPFAADSLSGQYTNGGIGGDQVVNFAFTDLQDTAGGGGTFSGNFSFTVAPVPEPAEYAAVAGLALGVFALVRRGRKAATSVG